MYMFKKLTIEQLKENIVRNFYKYDMKSRSHIGPTQIDEHSQVL